MSIKNCLNNICLYAIIIVILFASSCTEPDTIGIEVQPSSEKLSYNFIDTCLITSTSILDNHIRTDEATLQLLGSTNDPVFGNINASIYTQFRLSNDGFSFGNNPTIDSIVLSLAYTNYYGDPTLPINFNIYELTNDIYLDSIYYSNSKTTFNSTPILQTSITPNPQISDSVHIIKFTIPKTSYLWNKFLNTSDNNYADNTNFLNFFKGLLISTNQVSNKGCILYMNLLDINSYLNVYYHNATDTSKLNLVINDNCARFTNFEHYSYSQATDDLKAQISNTTSNKIQEKSYLQTTGGLKVKLQIPYLKNLKQKLGNIAINKAELIIVPDTNYLDNIPSRLVVSKIASDGTSLIIPDQITDNDYIDGYYNSNEKRYKLNITRYIQAIIDGNSDYGLNLIILGNAISVNNLIIIGNQNNKYKNKTHIEIFFTKIR